MNSLSFCIMLRVVGTLLLIVLQHAFGQSTLQGTKTSDRSRLSCPEVPCHLHSYPAEHCKVQTYFVSRGVTCSGCVEDICQGSQTIADSLIGKGPPPGTLHSLDSSSSHSNVNNLSGPRRINRFHSDNNIPSRLRNFRTSGNMRLMIDPANFILRNAARLRLNRIRDNTRSRAISQITCPEINCDIHHKPESHCTIETYFNYHGKRCPGCVEDTCITSERRKTSGDHNHEHSSSHHLDKSHIIPYRVSRLNQNSRHVQGPNRLSERQSQQLKEVKNPLQRRRNRISQRVGHNIKSDRTTKSSRVTCPDLPCHLHHFPADHCKVETFFVYRGLSCDGCVEDICHGSQEVAASLIGHDLAIPTLSPIDQFSATTDMRHFSGRRNPSRVQPITPTDVPKREVTCPTIECNFHHKPDDHCMVETYFRYHGKRCPGCIEDACLGRNSATRSSLGKHDSGHNHEHVLAAKNQNQSPQGISSVLQHTQLRGPSFSNHNSGHRHEHGLVHKSPNPNGHLGVSRVSQKLRGRNLNHLNSGNKHQHEFAPGNGNQNVPLGVSRISKSMRGHNSNKHESGHNHDQRFLTENHNHNGPRVTRISQNLREHKSDHHLSDGHIPKDIQQIHGTDSQFQNVNNRNTGIEIIQKDGQHSQDDRTSSKSRVSCPKISCHLHQFPSEHCKVETFFVYHGLSCPSCTEDICYGSQTIADALIGHDMPPGLPHQNGIESQNNAGHGVSGNAGTREKPVTCPKIECSNHHKPDSHCSVKTHFLYHGKRCPGCKEDICLGAQTIHDSLIGKNDTEHSHGHISHHDQLPINVQTENKVPQRQTFLDKIQMNPSSLLRGQKANQKTSTKQQIDQNSNDRGSSKSWPSSTSKQTETSSANNDKVITINQKPTSSRHTGRRIGIDRFTGNARSYLQSLLHPMFNV